MSARSQLQSKPVADLRSIAESLGIEHKGLQKAKLIDLLVEHSDEILDTEETEVAEVISKSSNDDGPSVVSSGDSEIKKGDTRDGILDILPEGYGFLRCNGYKPSEDDVYVAAGLIKKFRMRKGDMVSGPIRAPRQKEKYPALIEPSTVNDADPELLARRVDFNKLTPLFPDERLKLEMDGKPEKILPRIIDLIAPIGKGQRGLIVSPPKAGKTTILKEIANSITTNNPEVYLMVVLVDERPEEVTDMQRSAHNLATPASGRILSGRVDSTALTPPKQFFGAARNIEGGGSLTILGTALVETGSKMDEVIFEEFKGTGNMELRLDRQLADKRVFPAIDVTPSGTREEQRLVSPKELESLWALRRVLVALEGGAATELLIDKLKETKSNDAFLKDVAKAK